ncbi:MAG: 30S ribosome-binding factor RbfA [Chloroflexota bacterium]
MVSKLRSQRIADRIREELSELLIQDVSDPRLAGISITDVTVDRELTVANIYVSALEGSSRSREVLEGLQHAQGFLRHTLAQLIDLRIFPHLRFHWDPTYERADRIERLIASLHEDEDQPAQDESDRE